MKTHNPPLTRDPPGASPGHTQPAPQSEARNTMGEDIPDGPMAPLPKRNPPRRAKDLTPAQLAKAITAAENRLCRLLSEAFSDGHNRMVNNFRVRLAAEEAQKALAKAHPTSVAE